MCICVRVSMICWGRNARRRQPKERGRGRRLVSPWPLHGDCGFSERGEVYYNQKFLLKIHQQNTWSERAIKKHIVYQFRCVSSYHYWLYAFTTSLNGSVLCAQRRSTQCVPRCSSESQPISYTRFLVYSYLCVRGWIQTNRGFAPKSDCNFRINGELVHV